MMSYKLDFICKLIKKFMTYEQAWVNKSTSVFNATLDFYDLAILFMNFL